MTFSGVSGVLFILHYSLFFIYYNWGIMNAIKENPLLEKSLHFAARIVILSFH